MNTDNLYVRHLRRLKWVILALTALFLAAVESYYYFIRGVPLVEDLIDWLIGMVIAVVLIEVAFRSVAKLQNRLQQEITDRKRADEALRESESRHRLLAENVRDIIWTVDMNLRFTYVSPSVQRLHGYSVKEATSKGLVEILTPASYELAMKVLEEELATEKSEIKDLHRSRTLQFEHIRKDSSTVWTEDNMTFLRDEDDRPVGILGVTRDITDRKRAEEALRKSEERYRTVVDHTRDCVWRMDMDGHFTFMSPAMKRMFGYDPKELLGEPFERILTDESAREVRESLERRKRGELEDEGITVELTHRRKDGTEFIGESRTTPIYGPGGEAIEIVGVTRDITERRHLEEQLRQAQKMEAVGTLAGGIAHDFNNLLSAILGNLSTTLKQIESSHPCYHRLGDAEKAAVRAADLTKQLLDFSRRSIVHLRPGNLNECVDEVVRLLRNTIDPRISIEHRKEEELEIVRADSSQIHQALLNLCLNSRDAMPDGGRLTVETRNVRPDEQFVRSHPGTRAGPFVRLSVIDNGHGIPPEIRPRIVEPFFTTKDVGQGTGLGLAMVYGIVKRHGGFILCDSQMSSGTRIDIYLPCAEERLEPELTESVDSDLRGTETILVVDNEELIRDEARDILQEHGYAVVEARDGRDAIELYGRILQSVDAVLLDLSIPDRSGREAMAEILEANPSAKVIVSSRFGSEDEARELLERGAAAVVAKPYRSEELARTVREVLDR